MRSLLWSTVFVLLMIELAVTLILVIPVPRKIRNWICLRVSKLELKKRLRVPLVLIVSALLFALADTIGYLSQIYAKEVRDAERIENVLDRHLIKEKEYRAGRNLYLVGFALTLIFVIGRITELMQEHAELEGTVENLRLAVSMMETKDRGERSGETPGEGIEMKPMQSKKKD